MGVGGASCRDGRATAKKPRHISGGLVQSNSVESIRKRFGTMNDGVHKQTSVVIVLSPSAWGIIIAVHQLTANNVFLLYEV